MPGSRGRWPSCSPGLCPFDRSSQRRRWIGGHTDRQNRDQDRADGIGEDIAVFIGINEIVRVSDFSDTAGLIKTVSPKRSAKGQKSAGHDPCRFADGGQHIVRGDRMVRSHHSLRLGKQLFRPQQELPPRTNDVLYSADCCAAFFASHSGTIFSSLEKANAHTAMIASRMAGTMA